MAEFDVVESWVGELRAHLDVEGLEDFDMARLLSVVREVAHGVIHPAGPVAMFMAGYAVARGGGSNEVTEATLSQISALAKQYAETQAGESTGCACQKS